MSRSRLWRPRRPHGSQTIPNAGSRTSDNVTGGGHLFDPLRDIEQPSFAGLLQRAGVGIARVGREVHKRRRA